MNIILIIIIIVIIIYLINNNKTIENISNTGKISSLEMDNEKSISTTNFNLVNEINYDSNTALSYMPNETTCNINLTSTPKEIIHNDYKYNLIGTAINKFYNQEYTLYESKIDQYGDLLMRENLDYLNEHIYSYIFVNFINNKIIIQQEFGPRNKIDIGDVIYLDIKHLNNGISYIGPYIII